MKPMSILQLILLAIIQGLTEFLPISSSAHLILPAKLWGWEDQGPLIDVMAHFGSIFAVLIYFRRDVVSVLSGCVDLLARRLNKNSALALNLIVATPPALLMGLFLTTGGWDVMLRNPVIIAFTSIFFGLVLWWADKVHARKKTVDELSWKGALGMGLAQSIALIPGTSRSGITMTAARMMQMTRVESARFSMLMSIPIIAVGGLYSLLKLYTAGPGDNADLTAGLTVAALSFLAAYLAIAFFMKLVSRIGMFPFMVYRVALGGVILIWVFLL